MTYGTSTNSTELVKAGNSLTRSSCGVTEIDSLPETFTEIRQVFDRLQHTSIAYNYSLVKRAMQLLDEVSGQIPETTRAAGYFKLAWSFTSTTSGLQHPLVSRIVEIADRGGLPADNMLKGISKFLSSSHLDQLALAEDLIRAGLPHVERAMDQTVLLDLRKWVGYFGGCDSAAHLVKVINDRLKNLAEDTLALTENSISGREQLNGADGVPRLI